MTRILSTSIILLSLCVLALSGCTVTSESPLTSLADSEPMPEFLEGSWEFVEIAKLDATGKSGGVVFESAADGTTTILLTENSSTTELNASFANVAGLQVLSIAPRAGEDQWMLASLTFDQPTQQLTVTFLHQAVVAEDIQVGRVQGELYPFDDEELAGLTASSAQLRTYLSDHGDAAFSDRMMILRKLATP